MRFLIAMAIATGFFPLVIAFWCKQYQLVLNEIEVYTRYEPQLLTLGPSDSVYKSI